MLNNRDGSTMASPPHPVLATDGHVGDSVAFIASLAANVTLTLTTNWVGWRAAFDAVQENVIGRTFLLVTLTIAFLLSFSGDGRHDAGHAKLFRTFNLPTSVIFLLPFGNLMLFSVSICAGRIGL